MPTDAMYTDDSIYHKVAQILSHSELCVFIRDCTCLITLPCYHSFARCSMYSSVHQTGNCCAKLTAIKCVSGTRKLSITADDQLVELYADGVATAFQPGGWGIVRVVDIPEDTQVIAVKAIDVAKVSSIVSFESVFFMLRL